jgi:dihydrofolate reductase
VGKLVVSEFVTVDGVMEDPGGGEAFEHGGWAFKFERGDEGDKFKLDETLNADAMLLGRVTYEGFAAVWPTIEDEAGFADKMNSMPKRVVSTTSPELTWNNSALVEGDLTDAVTKLTDEFDGDILVAGSATLVQALVDNDLVDELRLMVCPIVLGSGRRLFGELEDTKSFQLVESRPVGDDGVVVLIYQPKRAR